MCTALGSGIDLCGRVKGKSRDEFGEGRALVLKF